MKRFSTLAPTTTLVLLVVAASQSRADYLNWGYSTTTTPPGITSGTGSVQLTGVATGTAAASIPILGIQDSSTATAGSPDAYHNNFSLAMTFTDNATNDSGTLTLSGHLSGSLSATNSSVAVSFNGPNSLTLDGHVYTVNIPSLNLTAPAASQQTLSANVTVTNAPGNGSNDNHPGGNPHILPNVAPVSNPQSLASAPEPASLMLGGLGWSLLGAGCWWKRSRRALARG